VTRFEGGAPARPAEGEGTPRREGRRRARSILAGAPAGAGEPRGLAPHQRAWFRGLFRAAPAGPALSGLAVSLAAHAALGAAVVTGALDGVGGWHRVEAPVAPVVAVELPKIDPAPPAPPQLQPARAPAAPAGETEGPVPKGRRARKGRDEVDDAARLGVLGMIGDLGGKGNTRSRERGGTAGPDQRSAEPFAGLAAGLRDYPGGFLPVGGSGGRGVGTDEGGGSGGGRGSGRAKDLLNSYGDGTGDQIVLERRGAARGVDGGTGGTGSDLGCRDEESIARVVSANKGAIRRCYNRALERDEGLRGEISVRFVIAESGAVRSVETSHATISDAALLACVHEQVRALAFGERAGCETIVRYTFNLTRGY
jgi:hypothetical protein